MPAGFFISRNKGLPELCPSSLIYINTFQRECAVIARYRKEGAMSWSDYWPMPWMFFGPPMMLILLFLCLAAVGKIPGGRGGHAIEILKERYARGEIDKAEFEDRRHSLEA